ncbi:hypothetical protein A3Q56_08564 [Intoshia linei]|uniref:Uncharacterized protein n=1 Tax=Intoshia linei TaxID=1819745 RepID=A0A177API9_9BILA|nr:hypothetical protein A3Q56_08564 [Intoshia linei]
MNNNKFFDSPKIWSPPKFSDGCYFCYVKENNNLNDWQIYLNLTLSIYPKIKLSTANINLNTSTSGIDTTNSMD